MKNKYLIGRRILQLFILTLFAGGNYAGWQILQGNYSSAKLLNEIPLSDPFAALQSLASGYVLATEALVGAGIILVLYALLGGRTFCAWICPMNMVSDLALFLRKRLKLGSFFSIQIPKQVRYAVMILALLLSAIYGFAAFEMISPIGILHRGVIYGIGASWAVILFIFLADLVLLENAWCGHLCPLGAFYALVGKIGLWRVKHKQEACTSCMKCFEVCPEEQVLSIVTHKSGIIKSSECTNCGRCVEVCEDNALHFL